MENKKLAAIAAALACLGSESTVDATAARAHRSADDSRLSSNPWASYGRQQIMNMRTLVQRRAFRR